MLELLPEGLALQILALVLNGSQGSCKAVAPAFHPSGLPAQVAQAADLVIELGAREPFDGEVDRSGGRRAALGPWAWAGLFQLDFAQLPGEDQAFH